MCVRDVQYCTVVGHCVLVIIIVTKVNITLYVIIIVGVMRLRLPSLVMLNLDWTCVTELSSLHYLRENGEALECVAVFSSPP